MSREQKTVVITGATSGIGWSVAESLVRDGVSVVGVGRSVERCRQAEQQLRAVGAEQAHVTFLVADLSLQQEVRRLAREIREILKGWNRAHLDALINNAATVPFWQILTPEGFDMQWAVNHLAAFLLTAELLPLLTRAPLARVVTVSSGSHYHTRLNWEDIQLRRRYNPLAAYNQTKLANVLFTVELNRRLGVNSNVRAFAADPGLVNTDLGLKSNSFLARRVWDVRRRGGVPSREAARGIVFLATEPSIQTSPEVYWKNCKPKAPSSYALDAQAARELWELSSQMCSVVIERGAS